MNIIKIVAVGIVATIFIVLLKPSRPEIATVLAVGAGIIITLSVLDELFEIVYTFYDIADSTGIERGIFSSILKIIGIGYLTEFANGICVDLSLIHI